MPITRKAGKLFSLLRAILPARINSQIQSVREDADARIKSAVETANSLLEQIEKLNVEIAKATVINADSSGAQTAQAALIDQLSGLMDVRITGRAVGGVEIRTGAGILLARSLLG